MKPSNYVRQTMLDVRPKARPIIVHDDVEIVAGLHQFAKIGNNLNQITRVIPEKAPAGLL